MAIIESYGSQSASNGKKIGKLISDDMSLKGGFLGDLTKNPWNFSLNIFLLSQSSDKYCYGVGDVMLKLDIILRN